MATPHIEANKDDIAEVVLMPGDPLRAKFIAETYLTEILMFNDVRNMLGYTGYYNGKRVSVMGSGMGMPSMGIYSYELYKFYDVKKIIRIGSCGALVSSLNLFDVVLVKSSYSDSNYAYVQSRSKDKIIASSSQLTDKIAETALEEGIKIVKGNVYSTDAFYKESNVINKDIKKYNCIATEMESFALFHNAKILNKEAACLLTVSDSLVTKAEISPEERERSFVAMVELALKSL